MEQERKKNEKTNKKKSLSFASSFLFLFFWPEPLDWRGTVLARELEFWIREFPRILGRILSRPRFCVTFPLIFLLLLFFSSLRIPPPSLPISSLAAGWRAGSRRRLPEIILRSNHACMARGRIFRMVGLAFEPATTTTRLLDWALSPEHWAVSTEHWALLFLETYTSSIVFGQSFYVCISNHKTYEQHWEVGAALISSEYSVAKTWNRKRKLVTQNEKRKRKRKKRKKKIKDSVCLQQVKFTDWMDG